MRVSSIRPVVLLITLFTCTAKAADISSIHWQGEPFFLVSRGMPLAKVIEHLGENYNVPIKVSNKINDTYIGTIQNKTPVTILSSLSNQYNLVYYYDNNTLYVYKAWEINSKINSLKNLSEKVLKDYLNTAGILANKTCEIKPIFDMSSFQVSGVPACISNVEKLSQQLDTNKQREMSSTITIGVFPLKYASVNDTVYSYRGQNVTIPGLVSELRQINPAQSVSIGTNSIETTTNLPVFTADTRRNAVIVKDRASHLSMYRNLIARLDKKPIMIEVMVSIIDVDAANINALGIDWSASARLGGGKLTFNSGLVDSNFSTLIGNTSDFMVRLNALENQSKAKILSQPSVVTLNNIQAVLDKNITFYTKLEGNKVAKLENITTGSLLRVTPRLIKKHNHNEVMLNLNIQDGQQKAPTNVEEPLPQVQNSEIATQATLKTGESLLLGGFIQNKETNIQNKIPLLGDIPLIGGLFRSTTHQKQNVVRLFLIKAIPLKSDS